MRALITIILQFVIGLFVPVAVYAAGIGNSWELVAFAIGYALVVSAIGWIVARLMSGETPSLVRVFVGALIGGALGAALLLIPVAWGFAGVLLPLLGAIAGYHLADLI